MNKITTGNSNVGVGSHSLLNITTGNNNVTVGNESLVALLTGDHNLSFGRNVLWSIENSSRNIAMGSYAGANLKTIGNENILIGYESIGNSTNIGSDNIAIGRNSLWNLNSSSNNIAIGSLAGHTITTGSNNVLIGKNITTILPTDSNQLNIGNWLKGNNGLINIPNLAGVGNRMVIADPTGTLSTQSISTISWSLTGNSATNPATNFIGTTDAQPLVFRTNNTEKLRVDTSGNIGIGITNPSATITLKAKDSSFDTQSLLFVDPSVYNVPYFNIKNNGNTGIGMQAETKTRLKVRGENLSFDYKALYLAGLVDTYGHETSLLDVRNNGNTGVGLQAETKTRLKVRGENLSFDYKALYLTGLVDIYGNETSLLDVRNNGNIGIAMAPNINYRLNIFGEDTTFEKGLIYGISRLDSWGHNIVSLDIRNNGNTGIGGLADTNYKLKVYGNSILNGTVTLATPVANTTNTKFLTIDNTGVITTRELNTFNTGVGGSTSVWSLTGNSATNPTTNFIGTTDAQPLLFRTNNTEKLRITTTGKVGIGTINTECATCSGFKLFVKDGIRTERVKVDVASTATWADYVFNKEYKLMPLSEVEKFISENKHLPNIPSAQEVVQNGLDLGEINSKLLQKIEELTLHTIELNKKNETQEKLLKELYQKFSELEQKISK